MDRGERQLLEMQMLAYARSFAEGYAETVAETSIEPYEEAYAKAYDRIWDKALERARVRVWDTGVAEYRVRKKTKQLLDILHAGRNVQALAKLIDETPEFVRQIALENGLTDLVDLQQ